MDYRDKTNKELKAIIRQKELCEKLEVSKSWLEKQGSRETMLVILNDFDLADNRFYNYSSSQSCVYSFIGRTGNIPPMPSRPVITRTVGVDPASGASSVSMPNPWLTDIEDQPMPTAPTARTQLTPKTNKTKTRAIYGKGQDNGNNETQSTLDAFAKLLNVQSINNDINIEQVNKLITEALNGHNKTLNIKTLDKTNIEIKNAHKSLETVIKIVSANLPLFLYGGAGSGKTHACSQVAKALDLPFYHISVCEQSSKTDLLGYMFGQDYITTGFRKAYETGGVFLLDEIDNGNPNVISVLNSATSNGNCTFPDKEIPKHENFRMIAAGNTIMLGGDITYIGRNALDGATRDRFTFVNWEYDSNLERNLAMEYASTADLQIKIDKLVNNVQVMRRKATDLKLDIIISPRASISGAKLLQVGFPENEVREMTIFKGINKDIQNKLSGACV